VTLGDVTDTMSGIAVVGPAAAELVSGVLPVASAALATLPHHGNLRTTLGAESVGVVQVGDAGVPGYDVILDRAVLPAFQQALGGRGAPLLDPAAMAALRIEAGIPKFHVDMDEDTIPLEAGIEGEAISMTKGCYVGQEVIIRVLHRGHGRVAR